MNPFLESWLDIEYNAIRHSCVLLVMIYRRYHFSKRENKRGFISFIASGCLKQNHDNHFCLQHNCRDLHQINLRN